MGEKYRSLNMQRVGTWPKKEGHVKSRTAARVRIICTRAAENSLSFYDFNDVFA